MRIAVVIPSYKVRTHILSVIASMPGLVEKIYVVDDCCPENSGEFVRENCPDARVVVIREEVNQGVGGAVMSGYLAAMQDGMDVIVKIDGDGQMDPALLPDFIEPIVEGNADYTKGNRFFDIESVQAMPPMRLFGNAVLSFMTKFSSGYWDLFDPTNGYTAIHVDLVKHLPLKKISKRYFFETDILFRLNILRAVVQDIPMDAKYGDEVSNLKISKILGEFLLKHVRNFIKRIFYNYYLRDMSVASLELPIGVLLFLFGVIFGWIAWASNSRMSHFSSAGTVMLSALPVLVGVQFILAFISHDVASTPKKIFHRKTKTKKNHAFQRETTLS